MKPPFLNWTIRVTLLVSIALLAFFSCTDSPQKSDETSAASTQYAGLNDTAKYVGMQTCKLCHQDKFDTFIHTGMGQSFDSALQAKSAADYSHANQVYDHILDLQYNAYWKNKQLYFHEFRLKGKDTIHTKTERVSYIVGSGQHTNSHMLLNNGYLYQMPMTYYTQKRKWDLPPGFENGNNTRFSRKIGLECMSCHNGYPHFVQGSENKYVKLPKGIDCERCHGPGSEHVAQRSTGSKIDTAKYIDYSIVNPGKLSVDKQFDVCQRCHLQGNAVLKEGKSFYDFKPGMQLSDVMSVFLPKYKGAEDQFIMASHADRLKMSACFLSMEKKQADAQGLRPYKNALTCVTCHNPHVSVTQTGVAVFNAKCISCHASTAQTKCTEKETVRLKKQNNCVGCHMPKSGSVDIPHVRVTDHFIRKSIQKGVKQLPENFMGLYSVNDKHPSPLTLAQAYVNQFEKFESNPAFLDSAVHYLPAKLSAQNTAFIPVFIQTYFMKQDFKRIATEVEVLGNDFTLNYLNKTGYSNTHAWTCYRIAESYVYAGNLKAADLFYAQAVKLAPYVSEFRNKYGANLLSLNQPALALKQFELITREEPMFAPAWANLGYLKLMTNQEKEALACYEKAIHLNPDYVQGLLNLAGYYIFKKEYLVAQNYLMRILKIVPDHAQAREALVQVRKMKTN